MPNRFQPIVPAVMADQNTGGRAKLFKIAAWITEGGATAWIKDGYGNQGADKLYIRCQGEDEGTVVLEYQWVVQVDYGRFVVMDDDDFREAYISYGEIKRSIDYERQSVTKTLRNDIQALEDTNG